MKHIAQVVLINDEGSGMSPADSLRISAPLVVGLVILVILYVRLMRSMKKQEELEAKKRAKLLMNRYK